MAKLIALTGSPDSGKTVNGIKLAQEIYEMTKRRVIFLCPDLTVPVMGYLFPHNRDDDLQSLGMALDHTDIYKEDVLRRIVTVKTMSDFGYLGFKAGENKYTYPRPTEDKILRLLLPDYIEGLTLLGGEPFEPENQAVLVGLLRKVRRIYPKKSIWCYTGYTYEKDLLKGGSRHTSFTDEMLSLIDVLVDGRFLLAEKDITLLYRGSRNQRILALHSGKEDKEDAGYAGTGARDALKEIEDLARGDSRWK